MNFTDDISPLEAQELNFETIRNGEQLFARLDDDRPHVYERRWWDERLLAWSMHDEAIKVQMFRFVDVLPMLHSAEDVARHLDEYLGAEPERLPTVLRVLLGTLKRLPFTAPAVARAARLSAADMARRFIAGENTAQVMAAAERQRKLGRAFTLDILGEAVISEREAEAFFQAYLQLIETVAPLVNAWPDHPLLDHDDQGPLPRMNLSVKLSALDCRFDALDPAGTLRRVGGRLRELLRTARRQRAFLNVDMESYDKKDLTLHIFKSILLEPEFRDTRDVGIVIQCYLHDAERDLRELANWAAARGAPVSVRIVKGAYWDHETIRARSCDWPIPVFQEKWQSDANFERQTRFLLDHRRHLRPALGTHNLRSIAHALAYANRRGIEANEFELQMLFGMADAEKNALVNLGRRLRIYMPYGDLLPGMAYLVRRLLENTSNDSFLKAGFIDRAAPAKLLRDPEAIGREAAEMRDFKPWNPKPSPRFAPTFVNEPPVDFAIAANRDALAAAVTKVGGELGSHYPLVINGEYVTTDEQLVSLDPADRLRVVGTFSSAAADHARQAVAAAKAALPEWRKTGVAGRAEYLRRAAAVMRERKFELAAWEAFECGKQPREATADVDEAIDFCEFYAAEALALFGEHGVDVAGEENRFDYLPRGVTAVIAPWNFPLAILTGMTTAALATGNTVVMKPAEQSTVVAALLMEIFQSVNLPPGVLHFLPGKGETVGAELVDHPDVALIAFTGSRTVGLTINARAAELSRHGLPQVKRVIAEMGGKNAIIVDTDADLDEAVVGVMKSAFGYQGQKCSACSRAIVLDAVYDQFLTRLVEAVESLPLGPAIDPAFPIGPVINDEAAQTIRNYIEIGKREGKLVLGGDLETAAERGSFVPPHIFADVAPSARIAQEEIFGPVLAVIRAANFDEALQIANGVDYALTGGVFSRSPVHLQRSREEFLVGNLYFNRAITGALVGRQPFGGFKMSGIGSKAGGREYLLQFVLPRTVTEHTVRRGFAPPASDGE